MVDFDVGRQVPANDIFHFKFCSKIYSVCGKGKLFPDTEYEEMKAKRIAAIQDGVIEPPADRQCQSKGQKEVQVPAH